jgi:hypothetical protein
MKYLHRCSETFIKQTHGEVTWQSLQKNINYILTHPNGWGGPQQADMRRAAILAGLISESKEDQSRINFVTEGEASLHFCLLNGLTIDGANVSLLFISGLFIASDSKKFRIPRGSRSLMLAGVRLT